MLTATDFRRIVLGLRDTIESAHMGHPDFRVNGRIFASLTSDEARGMVVLTPEQQQRFVREAPTVFEPEAGAWGRAGCTRVHLSSAGEEAVGEAATLARQNAIAKGPTRSTSKPASKRKRKSTATSKASGRRAPSRR